MSTPFMLHYQLETSTEYIRTRLNSKQPNRYANKQARTHTHTPKTPFRSSFSHRLVSGHHLKCDPQEVHSCSCGSLSGVSPLLHHRWSQGTHSLKGQLLWLSAFQRTEIQPSLPGHHEILLPGAVSTLIVWRDGFQSLPSMAPGTFFLDTE